MFLIKPTQKDKAEVFINPEIISMQEIPQAVKGKRKKGTSKLEGCLSLPNIWGVVHRSSEVTVSYLDENGKKHKKTFRGFPAVIIQHEYDHLQGILFPKRVLEQHEKLYKSSKDKKGEDIFEEMEI
ncbi:MAG: peptide deformylase [Candidatus Levybacteria bacterium]|nr:peptide deformylase [Candidatus Levybacteria bacterium]